MKNLSFIYSLLVVFALLSCSKTKFQYDKKIYLSEPEITWFTFDDYDSVAVKGFTRCEALDVCKGALPGNVAKESGFDKSYLYYIYEASVEVKDNEESLASFREYTNLGYSTREFENKGIGQVSVLKENGDKYLKTSTCLIHIFQEVGGEKQDIWYPCSPFDLEWSFFSIKNRRTAAKVRFVMADLIRQLILNGAYQRSIRSRVKPGMTDRIATFDTFPLL